MCTESPIFPTYQSHYLDQNTGDAELFNGSIENQLTQSYFESFIEEEITTQLADVNSKDRESCDDQAPRYSQLSSRENPQVISYPSNNLAMGVDFEEFAGGPAPGPSPPILDRGDGSSVPQFQPFQNETLPLAQQFTGSHSFSPIDSEGNSSDSSGGLPQHQIQQSQLQSQPPKKICEAKNISNIFYKRLEKLVELYRNYFDESAVVDGILREHGTSINKSRNLLLITEFRKFVQQHFAAEYNKFEEKLEKKPHSQAARYRKFYDKMWQFIHHPQQFKEWLPRPVARAHKKKAPNIVGKKANNESITDFI